MKWEFLDPDNFKAEKFGFSKLYAVKVRQYNGNNDIRSISIKGWSVITQLEEYNPFTKKKLKRSEWFIYAGKGE